MPDRRDLRFWLGNALSMWLHGLLAALVFWGFLMLTGIEVIRGSVNNLPAFLVIWMLINALLTMLNAASGMRMAIPVALAFGATRRATAVATRAVTLLPILSTMLVSLALGCIEALRVSPAFVLSFSAVSLAWCAVGDLLAILAQNRRIWGTLSLVYCGISGGAFGGFFSTNLFTGIDGILFQSLTLAVSPAVTVILVVALAVALLVNLGSMRLLRRVAVQF